MQHACFTSPQCQCGPSASVQLRRLIIPICPVLLDAMLLAHSQAIISPITISKLLAAAKTFGLRVKACYIFPIRIEYPR